MVGVKIDPPLYKSMVKLQFLQLHNLWLMYPISSKLWRNAQDYGFDGYYKIQDANGNGLICAWNY